MCRSMVDIQSATAKIRWGIKKRKIERKTEDRKKLQGKNIMAPLLHRAAIIKWQNRMAKPPQKPQQCKTSAVSDLSSVFRPRLGHTKLATYNPRTLGNNESTDATQVRVSDSSPHLWCSNNGWHLFMWCNLRIRCAVVLLLIEPFILILGHMLHWLSLFATWLIILGLATCLYWLETRLRDLGTTVLHTLLTISKLPVLKAAIDNAL